MGKYPTYPLRTREYDVYRRFPDRQQDKDSVTFLHPTHPNGNRKVDSLPYRLIHGVTYSVSAGCKIVILPELQYIYAVFTLIDGTLVACARPRIIRELWRLGESYTVRTRPNYQDTQVMEAMAKQGKRIIPVPNIDAAASRDFKLSRLRDSE